MDHASDEIRLEKLISLGFDMVHFDGSNLDYFTNLETSQKFIRILKDHYPNTLFEVEFNHINLTGAQVSKDSLTNPSQAYEFMTKTSADLLAISIGNLHGISVKFPETLDLNLLAKIRNKLPEDYFLTLHSGSCISPDQVAQAIKLGVVKININTELRNSFNQSIAKIYSGEVNQKIYDNFSPAINELKNIIKSKLIIFSTSKYA